ERIHDQSYRRDEAIESNALAVHIHHVRRWPASRPTCRSRRPPRTEHSNIPGMRIMYTRVLNENLLAAMKSITYKEQTFYRLSPTKALDLYLCQPIIGSAAMLRGTVSDGDL